MAEARGLVTGDSVGEIVDSGTAANDGFGDKAGGPGKADARGEIGLGRGINAVAVGTSAGEGGSTIHFELACGDLRDGVGGIGGLGAGRDGARSDIIEAINAAVVTLGGGRFAFEANAEVQREVGTDADVILQKDRVVIVLVLTPGIQVVLAGGGHAEKERGKVLPDGGGGRVIERAVGPVIAEGKKTVGKAGAELRFAVLANIGSELEGVFAL